MKKRTGITIALLSLLFGAHLSHGQGSFRQNIGGIYSSFSANFSYSSNEGQLFTGKIYYEYPGKVHIKLSDGRVIASNGVYLWLYSPKSMKCARQKVGGAGAAMFSILKPEHLVSSSDRRFVFQKDGAHLSELVLDTQNNMIKNARAKIGEKYITLSFSNVEVNVGMKASLFNYKPPTDAQLVENPFNKIAFRR